MEYISSVVMYVLFDNSITPQNVEYPVLVLVDDSDSMRYLITLG